MVLIYLNTNKRKVEIIDLESGFRAIRRLVAVGGYPSLWQPRFFSRNYRQPGQISLAMLSAARLTSRKISPSFACGLASTVMTASGPA